MLSNGKDAVLVATADNIEAVNIMALGWSLPSLAVSLSLASSYVTSYATLRDMALAIVGEAPFQHEVMPSSATILLKASNTFL